MDGMRLLNTEFTLSIRRLYPKAVYDAPPLCYKTATHPDGDWGYCLLRKDHDGECSPKNKWVVG